MKKSLLWILVLVMSISMVAAFSLYGCKEEEVAEEEVAAEEEATPVEEVAEEEITIKFWTHEHPPMKALTEEIAGMYEAENPNIKIEFETFPHVDYETTLITAIAGGEGPDAYDMGDWNIPAYYEKNMIAPVEPESFGFGSLEEMEAQWLPRSLEGFKIDGGIYGIPMEFNTFCLFINPDHFEEIGLDPEEDYPKTWTDVANIGSELKIVEDGIWEREGFDLPYHDAVWTMIVATPFFEQMSASIINDEGTECTLDSPEAIEAFTTYVELITKYETGTPNVGMNTSTEPNLDYASGELSMWITGPWAPPTFEGQPLEETYMVVPLPQTEDGVKEATILYAWSWAVNPQSENTAEAWRWINYLSSFQERFLTEVGYIQPRLGWLDSEAALGTKYLDVFIDDMQKGSYMVRTTKFGEISSALHKAMERCILDGQDVETSLNIAKDEIDAALQS